LLYHHDGVYDPFSILFSLALTYNNKN